jgi:hypothetical protein
LRPRRRPWLAVASLLLMVVTGGGFVLIHQRADAQVEVLVVARPVAAGQVLVTQDVRRARLTPAPGVDVILGSDVATVIGHAASVPLVSGSLLSRGEVGPAQWPPEGQVVVAVPVKAARLADGVAAGSHVLVMEVAKDPTTGGAAAPDTAKAATGSAVQAVVVSVRPGVEGSGTATISLLVDRQDAAVVAGSVRSCPWRWRGDDGGCWSWWGR